MPSVFTDEKGGLDLQIANQTGIAFATLMPNGDPIADNPNTSSSDQNIAVRAIGTPPSWLNALPGSPIGILLVWLVPSTIPANARNASFGVRNAVNGQRLFRFYAQSNYAGSNEPRMEFSWHDSAGNLRSDVIFNPGFGTSLGSGLTSLWFIELQKVDSAGPSRGWNIVIRQVTAASESVIVNTNTSLFSVAHQALDSNLEFFASLPCGPTAGGTGYMGKHGYASVPFTFAERRSLALSMFSV